MMPLEKKRMWRHYSIEHETTYCYAYSVSSARHRAHLVPIDRQDQRVQSNALEINQPLTESTEGGDFFGNRYKDFAISVPHRLLSVRAQMVVAVRAPIWPTTSALWSGVSLARRSFDPGDQEGTAFALACAQYLVDSPMIPALPEATQWALGHLGSDQPLHQQLLAMTQAIHEEFVFDPEATTVGTPLRQVFQAKRGVCQDFAQLMIAALRSVGIPARYMSGYILTHPAPGQARLVGADATHAWVEAWCPGHGWLGLDPTNGKAVTDEFVTVACGRDYADVIPLRGVVVGGGEHSLEVSVTMTPQAAMKSVASAKSDSKLRQAIDTASQ
ncbi:MAG: transglutaminase family protein [Fluviibacter sp.]